MKFKFKFKFKNIFTKETWKKLCQPIKIPKGRMLRKIRLYHIIDSVFFLIIALWLAFITGQYIPPVGIVGIDIEYNKELDCVQVIAIDHLMPVYASGLQKYDCVVAVNKKSVIGLSPKKIENRIKGEPGTKVLLTVKRGKAYHWFEIVRVQPKLRVTPFD